MKLTAILIIAACLQVGAKGIAQTVTISVKNVTVQTVFKEIIRQTGVSIIYNEHVLNELPRVSINVKNASIDEIVLKCLKDQPLTYSFDNNIITIKKKAAPTSLNLPPADTSYLIQGKIIGEKEDALANVTILVKGTGTASQTNDDGSFSIKAKEGNILVISRVGYQPQEIVVGKSSAYNISMKLSEISLNELVVVGYTAERKKDITGSVAVVDMKSMKSIPTGSAEQALQGQAAGVTVVSSGVPGGKSSVFIRGVTSFGNTEPLIIVDGIQSNLTDINMSDIESVQVLKDAGAGSIYGVRGANGVVVVTTKKGKIGKTVISFDSYYGVQVPLKGNVFNLMNSQDYATLVKNVNPGTTLFANGLPDYMYAGPGQTGIGKSGDATVDPSKYFFDPANPANDYLIQEVNKTGTDWFHEVFKKAPLQSHNLTVSGGTDKSNYLFSLGYFNQEGTLINTYLKRYSVRFNSQYKIGKNIRIGGNAYLYYKTAPSFKNQNAFNPISFTYRMLPIIPVYDIKGNYGGSFAGPELGNGQNPVAFQHRTKNDKNNVWDIVGNIYGEVDLFKNFMFRTSFGGTVDNQHSIDFTYNAYNDKEGHTGENGMGEGSLYNSSWTWTNTLQYTKAIQNHHIKVLIGSEAISNYGRGVGGAANNFYSTDPAYLVLSNGTSNITNYSYAYANTLYSLFGRLDYAYHNKYLLSATIRRDGSSQFGSNNRYGIFPSFSAGWRVTNEKFMSGIKFLDDLKLKASWGKLGSQNNIKPNNAFTLYNSDFRRSYYDINGLSTNPQQGFYSFSNGNPNTSWEEDIITNIGFDATALNNKLDISVEWYKKEINGLLFPRPLAATAGNASAPIINIGDIQNTGWDFSASYHGSNQGGLKYTVAANITTYKNRVVSLPGNYFDVAPSPLGTLVRNQVGYAVGSFYGYEVERLFKDVADVSKSPTQDGAAPGRFKYKDMDGNNMITPDDRTFFGNPNPDFTYGINISLAYRNFDFSTFFYGSQGNDVLNHVRYYTDFFSTLVGGKSNDLLHNSWTPQNTSAKIPVAEFANSFSTAGTPNSYYLENGSFLKCRSAILGYNIPATGMQRFGISKFRIYVQASNLFTVTKYKGLDPELTGSVEGVLTSSFSGIDYGNYPNNQKSFLLGLSLSF